MRKGRFLISFILISVFLLSDLNCIHVQSESYAEGIVGQVKKYTSDFDAEEFNNCLENGEYHEAKELLEEAREGYQERWDYKGLTTNDMYVAYQFKEYMTDDFFSKGWWAKITSWFSGLFYNDELKEYIFRQSPGKDKYKDMLKQFISDTQQELVCLEYSRELISALESIDEFSEYIKEDNYDIVYRLFSEAGSREEIDKAAKQFINYNWGYFEKEGKTYMFKNNLSKIFTSVDVGIEYLDTTISVIMDIQYICANEEVTEKYINMLDNIQSIKYRNGEYVAPKDLRDAAQELKKELENKYLGIIETIVKEYGITTATMVIELLTSEIKDVFLNQILLGVDISSIIGNVIFDMGDLVKGVSYVQGYAYLGEIYTIILEDDRAEFLNNRSEACAQRFKDDYNLLYQIRLRGEEAYLDMCDFSGTWGEDNKKILQDWTGYLSKKNFCDNNIELINKLKFKEPDINFNNYNMLSRVNYYGFDGSLLYYETYAYYDNGLLCSKTFHIVYNNNNFLRGLSVFTFLYLYDENDNLINTVFDFPDSSHWVNNEKKGIVLRFKYKENEDYYETVFYPESERIDQEKFGVDSKRTEYIYNNALVFIDNGWVSLYLDSIINNDMITDMTTYGFLFLDTNLVPELWINYGYGYAGAEIYTVNNGNVDSVYADFNSSFIESGNLFHFNGGRMGSYWDRIYKIEHGQFVSVARGNYEESEDGYTYNYYWLEDGDEPQFNDMFDKDKAIEVTKDEYEQQLNSIFDKNRAIAIDQNIYTFNQCKLLLGAIAGK